MDPPAGNNAAFIGLNSGTSADGVDGVLVTFGDDAPAVLAAARVGYPDALREQIIGLSRGRQAASAENWGRLDSEIAEVFAECAHLLIPESNLPVAAIGSHGQTFAHGPDRTPAWTVQLGNPCLLAARTQRPVVADFRRADLAAGGQGAPLAPLIHRLLFADPGEDRAVVNLGGIANLSWLGAEGELAGWDTGPGNCLMDAWYQRHGKGPYDPGGRWAMGGTPDDGLLKTLLDDPYFHRPPPKSTGTEYFSPAWLGERLEGLRIHPADVQATLSELTARSVADSLAAADRRPATVRITGGGVHNRDLVDRLTRALKPATVQPVDAFGISPEQVEPMLFAWLARERLADRRIDTGPVTGAGAAIMMGQIHLPPARAGQDD